MPLAHSPFRWNHKALASLLVLALLLAQWSGFNHRIVHGAGQGSAGYASVSRALSAAAATDSGDSLHHSCLAFDAAALAATIHSAAFAGPLLPNVHVLALWIAFASWNAPFTCHFLSRAPPAV